MFRHIPRLEAYYWAARLGTFHAAAKRLGVTQPSITARIRELERDAGAPLFERIGRNAVLTERGSALFDQAERILTLISDLDGRMSGAGPLRGLLRFGAPDSFALLCLADFLKAVSAKHPELNVASTVDNSNALAAKLNEGSLDVAVINLSAVPKHFRTQPIGLQRLTWVASPALNAHRRALGPDDVARHPIITNPSPSPSFNILMDWFHGQAVAPPRLSTCNNFAAIAGVVEAGGGISLVPACVVTQQLAAGKLVELDVQPPVAHQRMVAAFSKASAPRSVSEIIGLARDVIGKTTFVEPGAADPVGA
jgi:DNA-binding transcriptional LysR family regulator